MSSTVTEITQGNLHIDSGESGTKPDTEAWKKYMGTRPVAARLGVLPETKVRRSALLTSTALQVAVAALLIALPVLFPQQLAEKIYEVTPLAAPDTTIPVPPKRPVVRARVKPVPPVVKTPPPRVAEIYVPHEMMAPRFKAAVVPRDEAPQMKREMAVRFESNESEPARPRPPVKTGMLTTGSVAVATINRPVEKVQTGGFGDPQGLSGKSNPTRRVNIAHFGSAALPPGPGYGNGSGGAKGARGVVESAGFGNGVAIPPSGRGTGPHGVVQSGGFATAVEGSAAPKAVAVKAAPAVEPVVILAKPQPVYTAEARQLRIQGDVVLQVVFLASGSVRVIRVLQGLGHGLNEAAVRAAEGIRFRPALQDGKTVDFPATVHIVFQLAY